MDYHLKVKAQRILSTDHTLQDGTTIPADTSLAGSYAVTLPTGKSIIMSDTDFEANSTVFLASRRGGSSRTGTAASLPRFGEPHSPLAIRHYPVHCHRRLTSFVSFIFAVIGKTPDAGYVKQIADNGADLVLYVIQFWLYYRAYKARVNATKIIQTTAQAAIVETEK